MKKSKINPSYPFIYLTSNLNWGEKMEAGIMFHAVKFYSVDPRSHFMKIKCEVHTDVHKSIFSQSLDAYFFVSVSLLDKI